MDRLSMLRGQFDVAVIGGGIIGAGIARDAARRGLRVALVEKADYGSGTTAGSTRLIHGGLRYLEMLDFRLVRMDLREREVLLRLARHLVRPLRFILPFYGEGIVHRWKMRAGLALYDLLSFDKSLPSRGFFEAGRLAEMEPELRREGLKGGASYYDAQVVSPERLALENVLDAREHGAVALNYAEVTDALVEGGRMVGVRVRDVLEGGECELHARVTVNASGPWLDRVAARLGPHPRPLLRTTKGVHLACDPVNRNAFALRSPLDGRLFFVIPWLGYSWVGTTDTDFEEDPSRAVATPEDIEYLVRSASHYFPALRRVRIHWTNAGVRALVRKPGSASSVSRQHRILADRAGLISVVGGKITGYRAIAEQVTDRVCRLLGHRRRSDTAEAPLPGGREQCGEGYLESVYGCRAREVRELAASDPELGSLLHPEYPDIAAQVVYSVRHEQCARLADFLLRRSLLGFRPDQGVRAVTAVAEWMARELGWSAARKQEEIRAYEQRVREVTP
ncbi:MAG: glycerol-3-phosphate dehydrogenase/oxidase [Bryobacterales bacterium]|nr:glycerol-3-phosphate dehydrogenase/oxidase [Bryobacterales bacterium]